MLYVVATPIGNLSDITFRAVEVLKACDYILCEDTRHSLLLLRHYNIQKPLKSFHKFNEISKERAIIQDLKAGKKIALISDAGTPAISDPGEHLIKACLKAEIPITAVPGACAAIQALCCSGLDTNRFQFLGFLPRKKEALQRALEEILTYPGTTVCYESPKRILKVLKLFAEISPDSPVVIAREMTKKFEEVLRGTAETLYLTCKERSIKGEVVLLISGETSPAKQKEWENLTPEQHVALLQKTYEISKKEAMKLVAKARKIPKRVLYRLLTQKSEG